MNKKQIYFDSTTTILQALAFLALGLFILCGTDIFLGIVSYGGSASFVVLGIIISLKNILVKSGKVIPINFLYSIINILIGCFIFYNPQLFISIFPLFFTMYILLDFAIKLTTFIIYIRNDIKGRFLVLIRAIMSFVFFVIMLFFPIFRDNVTFTLVGVYFIALSVTFFIDGIESMIPRTKMNKIKRKFKIALPIFVAAFIPRKALREINEIFLPYRKSKEIEIVKENIEPNIEVLVHVGLNSSANFGHVDIFFNNKVLSYGSYDEANVIFNSGIGDGVLFECDKEKYLSFCNKNAGKTIVGFGLKLNQVQIDAINKRIEKIKKDTYRWYPLSQLNNKKYKDYASKLYDETEAEFYKFTKGKFKTYFVLHTNCVFLADNLLGASGIDIIKLSGMIAPGTYYDYFEREFKRKNSSVVSKNIYMDKTGDM